MIIRSAVLEGTVAEEARADFDHQMTTTVLAAISRYPGLIEVRLRRPLEAEAGAPPVYMLFELCFPSLEAMHAALASPIRQEVRARLADVMKDFKGKVYHLVLDGGVSAKGAA
jgi:uncharacterized protein (TIGR02118 family)